MRWMVERTKKNVAHRITELACHTVKNTVGKSLPLLVHEVELPDSIKKEYLQTDNRDARPENGLEQGAFSM